MHLTTLEDKKTGKKQWVTAFNYCMATDAINSAKRIAGEFGLYQTDFLAWENDDLILKIEKEEGGENSLLSRDDGMYKREYWSKYKKDPNTDTSFIRFVTIEITFPASGKDVPDEEWASMDSEKLQKKIEEEIDDVGLTGFLDDFMSIDHEVKIDWSLPTKRKEDAPDTATTPSS